MTVTMVAAKTIDGHFPVMMSDLRPFHWILMYSLWMIGAAVGQGFAAALGRWLGAVWVIAVFNAIMFALGYWIFGKTNLLLVTVFVPFGIAFAVRLVPLVRREAAAG